MSDPRAGKKVSLGNWRLQSAVLLIGSLLISLLASRQSDPEAEIERTASIPATVCPNLGGDAVKSLRRLFDLAPGNSPLQRHV